ncbi:MAG: hypothetical protein WA847_10610, partial [Terriglobales bacterium]
VKREIRLPIDFDWGVRFLTVPPLLPVLAHGGGLKSRCNVVQIVSRAAIKPRKLQRSHYSGDQ